MTRILVVLLTLAALGAAQAAPVKVTFWHYISADDAKKQLEAQAASFNKSQSRYEVELVALGDYSTLAVRTIAALRSGGLPTMAMTDNAFFTRLAVGGQLLALDEFTAALPKATVSDFYPVLWDYGMVDAGAGPARRYGLPWAASTLLLYYNADALKARNVAPPKTWDQFAKAAKALTGRGTKGAIYVTDAWLFTSFVASQGGSALKDEKPDFDGKDSVSTLQYFYDLTKAGYLIPRNVKQFDIALLDFLRTRAFMVVAPTSIYPIAIEKSLAFKPGVVSLPGPTLAGEAQIAVFKDGDKAAQRGAFEFWQYLTEPENIARWTKASYYLPARRSAVKELGDFARTPVIAAGLESLERSINLPRLLEFNDWRGFLEQALEKSLVNGVDPKAALAEAQRQSLAVRK